MPRIEDNNAFLMAMGEGSRIEIHAADAAKDSWTQLDTTAAAGATTLRLSEDTDWEVGDRIAIASSGFDMDEAEERTIVAVSNDGRTVTLDQALENDHYGEVDTYNNGLSGADRETWDLDMRAEVALLSRNVTIQGDDDSTQDGYGGHTMVMMGAEMHIDGVELTKMGQAGDLGKYPLHWHMLGDASGQYVTNSSIHHTFNKGMTIHGTQNTWVENNAIYDTVGHTYYFEDGSEFGNVLMNNLGMNSRATESVAAGPIGSDRTATSTYWVTNPNNHLVGNHAAGSDHAGFWILSQTNVEGVSASSGLYRGYVPLNQAPGQWTGNSSHSNGKDGIFIGRQFNELTGQSTGFDPALGQVFAVTDFTTYKNQDFGLWVRNGDGVWEDVKVADSKKGARFWGSNEVSDSLIVGRSDNSERIGYDVYHGWELYDMASYLKDVHFAGFSGELDAAIANHNGFGRSTNNSVSGVTFGDDVAQVFDTKVHGRTNDGRYELGGTLTGALHDLDGSLTGVEGAIITPGIIDHFPNKFADIRSKAFPGIEASGFNATQGAVWNTDGNYWVNPASSVIGKVVFGTSGDQSQRVDFTITRLDNGASLLYRDETQGLNNLAQLMVDGSGSVEYLVTYPDGLPPTRLLLEVRDLPQGATAYYRFRDTPNDLVIKGADQVGSKTALQNADGSAWFRADNGDVIVKMYADRFANRLSDAIDDLPRVGDDVYTDRVQLFFDPRPSDQPTGDLASLAAPADFRTDPNPDALPERADSTSDTVANTAGLPRWSDALTWGGNTPDAREVIVIGPGQQVVLDTSVQVAGIIVHGEGAALIVQDQNGKSIDLTADWILVNDGALFQAGTEANPLDTDFTLTLTGDDKTFDLDSEEYVAGNMPNTVFVSSDPVETVDPGVVRGRFFTDLDSNEAFDADDLAASGHRVALFRDGELVATTTTNQNGAYIFQGVAAGSGYVVRFYQQNADTEFVVTGGQFVGGAGNLNTPVFGVAAGQTVEQNALFEAPEGTPAPEPVEEFGVVRGRFFIDLDGDQAFDANDLSVSGHRVALFRDGELVATTNTNQSGAYIFQDVAAGSGYVVRFYRQNAETDFAAVGGQFVGPAGNLNTPVFGVAAGQTVRQNALFEAPESTPEPEPVEELGVVQGRFFTDLDGDAVFDANEAGEAGHRVDLFQFGERVATTTTNNNGRYTFQNVAAGEGYVVRFYDDDTKTDFIVQDGQVVGRAGNLNSAVFTVGVGQTVQQNALLEAPELVENSGPEIPDGGDGASPPQAGDDSETPDDGEGSGLPEGGDDSERPDGVILNGTEAGETMTGSAEADTMRGFGGDDILLGLGGDDQLHGNQGSDELSGGDGNDKVYGGQGADLLQGGAGNDVLSGKKDNDVLRGQGMNDKLLGGLGDDELFGGQGADVINGGQGKDKVRGGTGDDNLSGRGGDDILTGGRGNDRLDGGAGNDRLTGGADLDVFAFGRGYDADVVTDFQSGMDQIDLSAFAFASNDQALSIASEIGNDLVMDFGDGDVLTIKNVTQADIANGLLLA